MRGNPKVGAAAAAFMMTTCAVGVVAGASILGNKFPSNVFTPLGPEGFTKSVSAVFLQGWGFFTRDAREDRISIVTRQPNSTRWEILDQDATVQPKYAFGLSRLSRAESVDINMLYSAVKDDAEWEDCSPNGGFTDCIHPDQPVAHIEISPVTAEPLCSSEAALLRETPVPFGYRDLTRTKQTSAVAISVKCDD